MSLTRKRKKELRKLQHQAETLWEAQQAVLGQAGKVAREAGRQVGHFSREEVAPAVRQGVDTTVNASRKFYNGRVIPAAGAVVGSALSVWDAANEKRENLAAGRGFGDIDVKKLSKKAEAARKKFAKKYTVAEPKKKVGAGGVIAIILGVAAAVGVVYAAWQTLRADDELWVADDPLRAPEA